MFKKFLIILSSILIVAGLFACGNNAEVEELKRQVAELKQQNEKINGDLNSSILSIEDTQRRKSDSDEDDKVNNSTNKKTIDNDDASDKMTDEEIVMASLWVNAKVNGSVHHEEFEPAMEKLKEIGETEFFYELATYYWKNFNAEWDPSKAYNGIGEIYLGKYGDYDYYYDPQKAVKYFEKAIKISTSGDMNAVPNDEAMLNMGLIYASDDHGMKDVKLAKKYYNDAIKLGNYFAMGYLSELNIEEGDFKSAEKNIKAAYSRANELGKTEHAFNLLFNIARLYDDESLDEYYTPDMAGNKQIRDYEIAYMNYEKVIEFFNKLNQTDNLYQDYIVSLFRLGKMNENGQGTNMDLDKAKQYYEEASSLSKDHWIWIEIKDDIESSLSALKYY